MVEEAATSNSPKRQNHGFIVAISAILALLTKRGGRKPKQNKDDDWKMDPKSQKSKPKKLLSNISNKALFHNHKKCNNKQSSMEEENDGGWGNGGVWQKEILMGGKCEPLDFSGVIYYDGNGKQLSEIPLRSPRASPLPGYLTRLTPQRTR
ncbi:uncharacterized protein LOC114179024 [Vigna unguiculata]|uniref:Transmembrane protein n=1 Tax=Vigna unguiculata TaxID=3917 RepID=A0A4D6KTA8_VIGUN|nr:uncharacterized protein LOC114179024 [Vigna unguiculata]QCD80732.1 hypothetical protein DEO72_LG2g1054 [Vigna unguiculata]